MYNLHIYEREDLTPIRKLLLMKALAGGEALKEYTETGNPITFETNVAKPMSVVAAFTLVQAGSGDPNPVDNVRPITGFTGANIYLSPTDSDDPAKQTFAVTFPAEAGTVYGGTLDITTGVLTVMYAGKVVRGTDYFYASAGYIKSDAFDAFIYINNPYSSLGICNILKRSNAGIWGDVGYPNTFRVNAEQLHINIANDLLGITDYTQETVTTATQKMKAYLEELYENGTPLMVVYPMSTPIEYQLSGTEIMSLIGNNVLWSDLNGNLNVTYKKKG